MNEPTSGRDDALVPLREYLEARVGEVDRRINEVLTEKDLRYQQRFDAQGQALTDTLLAVDKSTNAAFAAAEKATTKAEDAAQRRFEAVNEFRGQLTDQANTFIPRSEAVALIAALGERLDTATATINTQLAELKTDRISAAGAAAASRATFGYLVAGVGALAGLVGIVMAVLAATR